MDNERAGVRRQESCHIPNQLPPDRTPPRSETRNPPWDVRTEFLVLRPEMFSQSRLLVEENEKTESQPNSNTVFKNADAPEKQSLTENQAHDGNIHRISHIPK